MKKVYKGVTDILLTVLILFAATIYVPKLVGIQPLQVLSGSMEPVYHVGSLVYVKKTDFNSIKIGDTITFHLSADTLVTHRVVEKNDENQSFKTKGDANETEDGGEVFYGNVVGKVLFCIPFLGYAAAFLSTKSGIILMVSVIFLMILLTFIPEFIQKEDKKKKCTVEITK